MSCGSEVTPFLKGLIKLAILPDYKCPRLTCLALPPRQKSDMILPFEVVLKLKLQKNHFNKKSAPKVLFFNEKKNQKDLNDF